MIIFLLKCLGVILCVLVVIFALAVLRYEDLCISERYKKRESDIENGVEYAYTIEEIKEDSKK